MNSLSLYALNFPQTTTTLIPRKIVVVTNRNCTNNSVSLQEQKLVSKKLLTSFIWHLWGLQDWWVVNCGAEPPSRLLIFLRIVQILIMMIIIMVTVMIIIIIMSLIATILLDA